MVQKKIAIRKTLPVKGFIEKNSLGSWSRFRAMPIQDQRDIMRDAWCYKTIGKTVDAYLRDGLGESEPKEIYSPASRLLSIVSISGEKPLKAFWDSHETKFSAAMRCVSATDLLKIRMSIAPATGQERAAALAKSKLDGMLLMESLGRDAEYYGDAEHRKGYGWWEAIAAKLAAQKRPVDLSQHTAIIRLLFEAGQCLLDEVAEHNLKKVHNPLDVFYLAGAALHLAEEIDLVVRALRKVKRAESALPDGTKDEITGWIRALSDAPMLSAV